MHVCGYIKDTVIYSLWLYVVFEAADHQYEVKKQTKRYSFHNLIIRTTDHYHSLGMPLARNAWWSVTMIHPEFMSSGVFTHMHMLGPNSILLY